MTETIDTETGEIFPAAPRPVQPSTPYQSGETGQLADALAKAQGKMEPPKRTKTGKIQGTAKNGREYSYEYKYAPMEEVQRVVSAVLPENGLAWHQGVVSRGGEFFVRTMIRHSSGEWILSDYPIIADKAGAQGFAAGVTYARRYGLTLALGLAAEDDDDGAAAQAAEPDARVQARPAPSNLKAAVEARLSGEAPQRAPERPAAANGAKSRAQAKWEQIKDDIDQATTIEALNNSGIYRREPLAEIEPGVFITAAEEAQRILHSDPAAAKAGAWQKLVDRDARRRLEIVPQEETFNG